MIYYLQFDLFNNANVLGTLRQLLLLIRIWGSTKDGIRPQFTKTDDSFDIVSTLFSLITRFMENPNDESMLDDCLRLPSQVMIPPLLPNMQVDMN